MNKIIKPTLLWDSKETIQYIPPTIVGRKVEYKADPPVNEYTSKIYTVLAIMMEKLLIVDNYGYMFCVSPEDCKLIEEKE